MNSVQWTHITVTLADDNLQPNQQRHDSRITARFHNEIGQQTRHEHDNSSHDSVVNAEVLIAT